jgi:hypothetical protein
LQQTKTRNCEQGRIQLEQKPAFFFGLIECVPEIADPSSLGLSLNHRDSRGFVGGDVSDLFGVRHDGAAARNQRMPEILLSMPWPRRHGSRHLYMVSTVARLDGAIARVNEDCITHNEAFSDHLV